MVLKQIDSAEPEYLRFRHSYLTNQPINILIQRAHIALTTRGSSLSNLQRLSAVSLSLLDPHLALEQHSLSLTFLFYSDSDSRASAMLSADSHKRSFTGHHALMPASHDHTRVLFVPIVPTRAFISWTFGRGTVVSTSSPI
jgi:hypothetical protein